MSAHFLILWEIGIKALSLQIKERFGLFTRLGINNVPPFHNTSPRAEAVLEFCSARPRFTPNIGTVRT